MTISSTVSRLTYSGNGSTTAFSVSFKFIDPEDLVVYIDDTLKVIDTHYTVTGGAGATGTVTFLTAPASGTDVIIIRDVAVLQETDYSENDPFPAETHERALDRLTMIAQRNRDLLDRSMTLPDSAASVSTTLPVPEAGKIVAWNSDATALQNIDTQTLATVVAYGTANADLFDGDGVTTVFTLSDNPGALNNLDVSIGGVTQTPAVDYTWSAGTTITFLAAPPVGTDNVLVRYMQGLPQGTTEWNSVTDRPEVFVTDDQYGADPTGATDSYAAITAAIAATPDGGKLIMDGTFATSAKIVINPYRVQIAGNPTFVPYGSYSDYLVEFGMNGANDP